MSLSLKAFPVLRVSSLDSGYKLYSQLLGFHPSSELPSTPKRPGEAELWRDGASIRLREGATPGSFVLRLSGLASLRHDVTFRGGPPLPEIEELGPDFRRMVFDDPFGNRLIFEEAD